MEDAEQINRVNKTESHLLVNVFDSLESAIIKKASSCTEDDLRAVVRKAKKVALMIFQEETSLTASVFPLRERSLCNTIQPQKNVFGIKFGGTLSNLQSNAKPGFSGELNSQIHYRTYYSKQHDNDDCDHDDYEKENDSVIFDEKETDSVIFDEEENDSVIFNETKVKIKKKLPKKNETKKDNKSVEVAGKRNSCQKENMQCTGSRRIIKPLGKFRRRVALDGKAEKVETSFPLKVITRKSKGQQNENQVKRFKTKVASPKKGRKKLSSEIKNSNKINTKPTETFSVYNDSFEHLLDEMPEVERCSLNTEKLSKSQIQMVSMKTGQEKIFKQNTFVGIAERVKIRRSL